MGGIDVRKVNREVQFADPTRFCRCMTTKTDVEIERSHSSWFPKVIQPQQSREDAFNAGKSVAKISRPLSGSCTCFPYQFILFRPLFP